MRLIYLNSGYVKLIRAHGYSLKSLSMEDLETLLSYESLRHVMDQTECILSANEFLGKGFESAFSDRPYAENQESESEQTRLRSLVRDNQLNAVALSDGVILLYDVSEGGTSKEETTLENIFNALALITSVEQVMQTEQYQLFIQSL